MPARARTAHRRAARRLAGERAGMGIGVHDQLARALRVGRCADADGTSVVCARDLEGSSEVEVAVRRLAAEARGEVDVAANEGLRRSGAREIHAVDVLRRRLEEGDARRGGRGEGAGRDGDGGGEEAALQHRLAPYVSWR